MARVKRAVHGAKAKRATMELAKGYRGSRGRHYRAAKEQVMHSLRYAYRDRRARKGDFRTLWIARINAAARAEGLTYNRFIAGLRGAGVEIDRKVLADLAVTERAAFSALVTTAREGLNERSWQHHHEAPPDRERDHEREEPRRHRRPQARACARQDAHASRSLPDRGRPGPGGGPGRRCPPADHLRHRGGGRRPPGAGRRRPRRRRRDPGGGRPAAGRPRPDRDPTGPGRGGRQRGRHAGGPAAGADALVTTAGSVDLESPKAVRASAGSLFHLPVVGGADWPALAAALRQRGLALVGADPHAPDTIERAPLERPCALVLGNEAHGLPERVRADLDHLARLPQYGRAESLNLAAAAAVLLYESARRQREAAGGR